VVEELEEEPSVGGGVGGGVGGADEADTGDEER